MADKLGKQIVDHRQALCNEIIDCIEAFEKATGIVVDTVTCGFTEEQSDGGGLSSRLKKRTIHVRLEF